MDEKTFQSYRPLMFAIAYRMLGSAMEAEDILQEAYLRANVVDEIQAPKAFLSTVVTRLCLDQLKSAQTQRETYLGPWLPEPITTPATPFDNQYELISLAFLVLLESLTPVERAVFLLREVFDYPYDEIAQIVGKEEAACRQLFHRAKVHVHAHRPRFQASPEEHQALLERFILAIAEGDLEGLTSLLAQDAELWSDGGGKASAAIRPVLGADHVARFLLGLLRRMPPDFRTEVHQINGSTAFVVWDETGAPFSVLTLDTGDGLIHTFRMICNPDKLHGFAAG